MAVNPPPIARTTGTLADLHRQLGEVPLERIRLSPYPGFATVDDLLAPPSKPLCELIDGTLVEKAMGARESLLAAYVLTMLNAHVIKRRLGFVLGADAYIRLSPHTVRLPDVCFIPWDAFPERKLPQESVWNVTPTLIIEVLSPSNTPAEIDRKLREFFAKGTTLAWVIDPRTQSATEYTEPGEGVPITALYGRTVVPGFKLNVMDLFAHEQFPE